MNQSALDRLERLRVLSEAKPAGYFERLKEIQKGTRMIGQIFGIYGVTDEKTKQKEQELALEDVKKMSFEEKRKLYQAEFPNKVSPEKRAKARELLNEIAKNPQLFVTNNPAPSSNAKPVIANVITSRSWPSSAEEESDEEQLLTAPRIEKKVTLSDDVKTMSIKSASKGSSKTTKFSSRFKSLPKQPIEVDSRYNGTWKFGNFDNFAKIVPPERDDSDNESTATSIYEGHITPIEYDELKATPLSTCWW